jgi:hypothetical protein
MSEIFAKEGGPAFPLSIKDPEAAQETIYFGASMRDYFAAKAMAAVPMPQGALHDIQASYDRIAQHAYKVADAMLRAREK